MSEEKAYLKPIGKRLIEIREELGFKNRELFAAAFGVPKKTFEKYEQGLSELPTKLMLWLRDYYGISLSWLISGSGDMFDDPSKVPAKPIEVAPVTAQQLITAMQSMTQAASDLSSMQHVAEIPHRESIPVTVYAIKAAAGDGAAAIDERAIGTFSVDRAILRGAGVQPARAMMLDAKGDSMFPTIPDAAHLLVDSQDKKLRDNMVYVVSIENDILVKRVRRVGTDQLDLVSDNLDHHVRHLNKADLKRMNVIGRVFFVMKEL
jgi:phage repressor protein C with HTH and peptisase S24 domain